MLRIPTPEQAAVLRTELDAAGFTEAALIDRFGTANAVALDPEREATFRYATRRNESVDVLSWLLLLGRPVPRSETARLSPTLLALAEALDLVRVEKGDHVATCVLARHGDLLLASDTFLDQGEAGREHVLSTGPAARQLANFVIERPGARVLDLCGGGGVQGLLVSRWAREVCITDISARAIEYARRNAALNGITNCQFRVGSGFDPVEGERFDSIICNPPFVVTPQLEMVAVANDMELDGFSRWLTRQAPDHLVDDGLYQMVFEWTEQEGQPWPQRLSEWFEGLPCDALTLKVYSKHPHGYAVARMEELRRVTGSDDSTLYDWMSYYDARHVHSIHGGLLVMRKSERRSWLSFDELDDAPTGSSGRQVARQIEQFDLLARHGSDEDFLALLFGLAPGVRLEGAYGHGDAGWLPEEMQLRNTGVLPRTQGLAPAIAEFVGRLDGRTPLRDHLDALLERLDSDPAQVRADCLRIMRHLANRGFVVAEA